MFKSWFWGEDNRQFKILRLDKLIFKKTGKNTNGKQGIFLFVKLSSIVQCIISQTFSKIYIVIDGSWVNRGRTLHLFTFDFNIMMKVIL